MTNQVFINQRLWGRIRFLRRQAGITQKQLAPKIHMKQQDLSRSETGTRQKMIAYKDIYEIAQALGVTRDELTRGIGFPDEPLEVTGGSGNYVGKKFEADQPTHLRPKGGGSVEVVKQVAADAG
jgi:transcriptional regulator with XRE-family HTH domain